MMWSDAKRSRYWWETRGAGPAIAQPRQNGLKCRTCHARACNAAYARDVVQRCRMTGVASYESQSQSRSEGCGIQVTSAIPRLTSGLGQARDVRMAAVNCEEVVSCERVAYHAAPEVTAALPTNSPAPMDVEAGQLVPLTWPHREAARWRNSAMEMPRTVRQWSPGLRSSRWS